MFINLCRSKSFLQNALVCKTVTGATPGGPRQPVTVLILPRGPCGGSPEPWNPATRAPAALLGAAALSETDRTATSWAQTSNLGALPEAVCRCLAALPQQLSFFCDLQWGCAPNTGH